MNTMNRIRKLFFEMVSLVTSFFKPCGIKSDLVAVPKNVKHMGNVAGISSLIMTVISLTFAFMLKLSNLLIEQRMILLGLLAFMLYRGQQVVKESFNLFRDSECKKFDAIFEDSIILRGSQIIGVVSEKVFKYDEKAKLYRLLTNEEILNCIKNYFQNLWRQKIQHKFDIFEIVSVTLMICFAIATNEAIPQYVFIPLLLIFGLLSFLSSAYISMNRKSFAKRDKEFNNDQSNIVGDLLKNPQIVPQDLKMRIGRFQTSVSKSKENVKQFYKSYNLSHVFTTAMEAFAQYGVIILYIINVDWNSISLETIAKIAATLLIVETALGYIGKIAETLNRNSERVIAIANEESDMLAILKVYHEEVQRSSNSVHISNIQLEPFSVQLMKKSENDRPFTLTCKDKINIPAGSVVVLNGPSGSGKSTFMKLLTERIKLEKEGKVPTTSRYLFYDEKMKFGSSNIFDELFCMMENPDLVKMKDILSSLHLWQEIQKKCIDVWKWMKENTFDHSLSNGQKQRLILAKMLYWLNNDIDVVALDECTSGLDENSSSISDVASANAQQILEYVVRYCNREKSRIVIISTHQNIEKAISNLSGEYPAEYLIFAKEENGSKVTRQ